MRSVVFQSQSGSPDTDAWHAWRNAGVGGSDAPIIAADAGLLANKKPDWMKSINWLYLIKTGQEQQPDLSDNYAVQRGVENEAPARQIFEDRTGILLRPCFGEMDEYPFLRSSFDGLTFEQDALAEIKVPGQKVHELAKYDRVIDYYRPQIAHQALTAWGHPEGWKDQTTFFISYVPEDDDLVYVEKPAKHYRKLAEQLLAAEIKFWESVLNAVPPCGAEWLARAAQYVSAVTSLEMVKAQVEEAKQGLIDLLGNGTRLEGGGVAITRAMRSGSVDYTKLLMALMPSKTKEELDALCDQYRKPDSEALTVRLTPQKASTQLTI